MRTLFEVRLRSRQGNLRTTTILHASVAVGGYWKSSERLCLGPDAIVDIKRLVKKTYYYVSMFQIMAKFCVQILPDFGQLKYHICRNILMNNFGYTYPTRIRYV